MPWRVARGPCQRVNKTGSIGTAIYGVKVSSALLAHSIACEGHLRRHASTTTAAVATSATPTAATTHGRAPSGPLGGSGCDSCPDFHWKDLICGAKVRGTHGTSDSGMRAPERAALRLGTYGYHEAVRAPRTARPRHGVHVNTGLHRGKPRAEFDDAGMGRSRRLEVGHIARADGAKALPRGLRGPQKLLHSLPRWGALPADKSSTTRAFAEVGGPADKAGLRHESLPGWG